jgi:hypothetical protein
VGEDAFGGTDEVVAAVGMGGEGDHDGGSVGEGNLLCDGRPADDTGTLEMEEEKKTAEEALATAAFA